MKKRKSGKQRSDDENPTTAQTRGYKKVTTRAITKKKLPMSAIESSGPVSRPPLNSVPARPSVIFNAKRTQRRQLIACHTCGISGFFIQRPLYARWFFVSGRKSFAISFVRGPFSGQVQFVHNSTRNRRGRRSAPRFRGSSTASILRA